jgi:hypothetical protein
VNNFTAWLVSGLRCPGLPGWHWLEITGHFDDRCPHLSHGPQPDSIQWWTGLQSSSYIAMTFVVTDLRSQRP